VNQSPRPLCIRRPLHARCTPSWQASRRESERAIDDELVSDVGAVDVLDVFDAWERDEMQNAYLLCVFFSKILEIKGT